MVLNDYRFEELFEIPLKNGLTKPSKVRGSGIPMVNMKEIFAYNVIVDSTPMELVPMTDSERSGFILQNGDLLFARQSLVASGAGKVSYYNGTSETTFESHLIRCRINRIKAHPKYIYYLFTSTIGRAKIETIVEQTAAAGIRGSDLKSLRVSIPTLRIQKQIVDIFTTLDDKIELNRQMNQTLEEMAQAMFKHYFVDGIDKDNLPEGWELKKLKEEIDIKHGYAFKGEFFSESPTEDILITPGNFRIGGGFNYGKYKYYKSSYPKEYVFESEDLMVTMTDLSVNGDTIGYSALVPKLPNVRLLHNQRIGKVLFKSKPYLKFYLYWLMRTDSYHNFVLGSVSGTTVKHTSPNRICDYAALIPTEEAVRKFSATMREFYQQEQSNITENIFLQELRDYLLPKLISGEVIPANLKQLEQTL